MKRNIKKRVNVIINEKIYHLNSFYIENSKGMEGFDRNLCLNLANSMSMCIKLVIESDGHTIDYFFIFIAFHLTISLHNKK